MVKIQPKDSFNSTLLAVICNLVGTTEVLIRATVFQEHMLIIFIFCLLLASYALFSIF